MRIALRGPLLEPLALRPLAAVGAPAAWAQPLDAPPLEPLATLRPSRATAAAAATAAATAAGPPGATQLG